MMPKESPVARGMIAAVVLALFGTADGGSPRLSVS